MIVRLLERRSFGRSKGQNTKNEEIQHQEKIHFGNLFTQLYVQISIEGDGYTLLPPWRKERAWPYGSRSAVTIHKVQLNGENMRGDLSGILVHYEYPPSESSPSAREGRGVMCFLAWSLRGRPPQPDKCCLFQEIHGRNGPVPNGCSGGSVLNQIKQSTSPNSAAPNKICVTESLREPIEWSTILQAHGLKKFRRLEVEIEEGGRQVEDGPGGGQPVAGGESRLLEEFQFFEFVPSFALINN